MIKIEETLVAGVEAALRGMRNPMNSWNKSDSVPCYASSCIVCTASKGCDTMVDTEYVAGEDDLALMENLVKAGTDHRKFLRMITVSCDILAPLYWWKEYDTYKVGTVANSCSTMHTICNKEFFLDDFSFEHLDRFKEYVAYDEIHVYDCCAWLSTTVNQLNWLRKKYLETKDKKYWWQIIQLLPSSYNQKRTVMLNYEVFLNMYHARKNHKLDEWRDFCKWVEGLPYMGVFLNV